MIIVLVYPMLTSPGDIISTVTLHLIGESFSAISSLRDKGQVSLLALKNFFFLSPVSSVVHRRVTGVTEMPDIMLEFHYIPFKTFLWVSVD